MLQVPDTLPPLPIECDVKWQHIPTFAVFLIGFRELRIPSHFEIRTRFRYSEMGSASVKRGYTY
jgi:hypothetical protein